MLIIATTDTPVSFVGDSANIRRVFLRRRPGPYPRGGGCFPSDVRELHPVAGAPKYLGIGCNLAEQRWLPGTVCGTEPADGGGIPRPLFRFQSKAIP